MKSILAFLVSSALLISGYSQTRNVLVGTNNAVVQPTNFWSADASNARTGLGLDTAATNPASAFQPSSTVLSNLASSNGANLTNIPLASVFGALATNGNATNLTNFPAILLRTNGSALGLTNFPSSLLTTNGSGAGLTNITAANITGTVALASNVTGTIAISNGGSGATTAGGARTNFGLGWPALTNSNAATTLLGYNTNSQVLTPTNGIFFTNDIIAQRIVVENELYIYDQVNVVFDGDVYFGTIGFSDANAAATTRTNLGLGWSALTNTNALGFQTALFGTNTNPVLVNSNGSVVSPTNFWQVSPANTRVQLIQPVVNATNTATNARNLFLYSLAISTTGVTNTIQLPTNGGTLLGDVATVIHEGPTSSITAVRQIGSETNIITLNQFQEAVKFIYETGGWRLADNLSFVEAIYFSGTNASNNIAMSRSNLGLGVGQVVNFQRVNAEALSILLGTNTYFEADDAIFAVYSQAAFYNDSGILFEPTNNSAANTRTNLGLGLPALTNTNAAGFQRAIFTTNAAPTNSANVNGIGFNTAVAWMEVSVITNGVTNSYRIPLFQ